MTQADPPNQPAQPAANSQSPPEPAPANAQACIVARPTESVQFSNTGDSEQATGYLRSQGGEKG